MLTSDDNVSVAICGYSKLEHDNQEFSENLIPNEVKGLPVTAIMPNVFKGSKIQRITIPANIHRIYDKCFKNCTYLIDVSIAEGSCLELIGAEAFRNCGIRSIKIPDTVLKFSEKCFCNCSSLTNIDFGAASQLRSIGFHTFKGCNITHLRLGKFVYDIDGTSFVGVTQVSLDESNEYFICRDGGLYGNDRQKLIRYVGTDTVFALPDEVETLGRECFRGCKTVKLITLSPKSELRNIHEKACYRSSVEDISAITKELETLDPLGLHGVHKLIYRTTDIAVIDGVLSMRVGQHSYWVLQVLSQTARLNGEHQDADNWSCCESAIRSVDFYHARVYKGTFAGSLIEKIVFPSEMTKVSVLKQ